MTFTSLQALRGITCQPGHHGESVDRAGEGGLSWGEAGLQGTQSQAHGGTGQLSPEELQATRQSGAHEEQVCVQRRSPSPPSWVWRPVVSTRTPSAPSLRVTYKSRRTYLPALSCLVGPPCTSASWTGCRGRSGPCPQQDGDHDPHSSGHMYTVGSELHPSLTIHFPADVGGPAGLASPQTFLDRLSRCIALSV